MMMIMKKKTNESENELEREPRTVFCSAFFLSRYILMGRFFHSILTFVYHLWVCVSWAETNIVRHIAVTDIHCVCYAIEKKRENRLVFFSTDGGDDSVSGLCRFFSYWFFRFELLRKMRASNHKKKEKKEGCKVSVCYGTRAKMYRTFCLTLIRLFWCSFVFDWDDTLEWLEPLIGWYLMNVFVFNSIQFKKNEFSGAEKESLLQE